MSFLRGGTICRRRGALIARAGPSLGHAATGCVSCGCSRGALRRLRGLPLPPIPQRREPMFKWLKEKATRAAQRQCKFNIRLNTKTLASIANRAYAHLSVSGWAVDEADQREVKNAQKVLLNDILLGYSNGLSLEEIKTSVIDPSLSEV